MNQWSIRRKRIILLIVLAVFVFLIAVPIFFLFYRAPTCSDGKQNGDETGIDCGGSCRALCPAESLPLVLEGDPRVLTVATTTFEVVALVKNPNVNAEVYRARYLLKLFGAAGSIPLKVIEGVTFIPKNAGFVIFEGPFSLEGEVPGRATLEWEESLEWRKNLEPTPNLLVADKVIRNSDTKPKVEAVLVNVSLEEVSNIELTAIIKDPAGNIHAASKTFVERLPAGRSTPVIFTWAAGFGRETFNVDIIVRVFPDGSFLR